MTNSTPVLPFTERSLGDIVKHDTRAATVLERFGLDYCCGGHRTLQEARRERKESWLRPLWVVDAMRRA